jgi:hypothetical protein
LPSRSGRSKQDVDRRRKTRISANGFGDLRNEQQPADSGAIPNTIPG